MRLRIALVTLAAVVFGSSCASLKVNPSVYQKKKMAIVSVYGSKKPIMTGFGLGGSIQASTSSWTAKVIEDTYDEMTAKIQRTGATFAGNPNSAPSYSSLPLVNAPTEYVTYKSLKPLKIGEEMDAGMGKLATELKVDGVVIVAHDWQIAKDENSTRPYASDFFEIAIFGKDGARLWYQKDSVESAKADVSMGGIGASLTGTVSEKDAMEITREATLKAIDKFVKTWNENKTN